MPSDDPVVLDTHVWLGVALGRERSVATRVRRKIERAAALDSLYVAAITPWEIAMLARAGRIRITGPVLEFVTASLRDTRTAVAGLDPAVAIDAAHLPAWEHRDPADRMIVATARNLGAVLVTRDAAILDYGARSNAVRVLEAR